MTEEEFEFNLDLLMESVLAERNRADRAEANAKYWRAKYEAQFTSAPGGYLPVDPQ